ncbi:MAG: pyruvate, phosphate dikinase [Pseudomonadota bacterium]
MDKWIYTFGDGKAEGDASMRNQLGGKGANLAEMCSLGLPVPPGFTITTDACNWYYGNGKAFPDGLDNQLSQAFDHIEAVTGRKFGASTNPLLVSVRSGARASMPGMMDTVLNLGLNDETVEALAREACDERFAYDSYRRFIQMYGDVVMGVDHELFEEILDNAKAEGGYHNDTDLTSEDWLGVISGYKELILREMDVAFPQDPREQVWGAVAAVFSSWMNQRAITYRKLHDIPSEWGTAVTIQAMVFGNMGSDSATGVAFTRNPSTGERLLYGEFLVNAQGEDVVAGIRTPQDLTEAARIGAGSEHPSLEKLMPEAFGQFMDIATKLEGHYRDIQDLEFTIERGKLWMLQTRAGKRTAKAALRVAVEMAEEGLISREEAVMRIDPASLDQLLHPTISPKAHRDVIAAGLPASPGAATGEIVFKSDEAEELAKQGHQVVLVRIETSPEDIHGMHAAQGILTLRGGMTSHAAVVARGMGKPCVSGAGGMRIDYDAGELRVPGRTLKRGEVITIDGSTGQVLAGSVPMVQPELSGYFGTIMQWADEFRRMEVRANAETLIDARSAQNFGAEGIGLCRTEHMFFDETRIVAMREMILCDTENDRRKALSKLLPMQRSDFVELFEIMAGLPITIRLLDPPLHEFLPHLDEEIEQVAALMKMEPVELRRRADALKEFNPMLGHRGCRLAVSYPEIAEMQVRAIIEAAIQAGNSTGSKVDLEIMVPLVGLEKELEFIKTHIDAVAKTVMEETGQEIDYLVGTMIELPRAAIQAGQIAHSAQFFSFGTNDLTQTAFGISRDDATGFLPTYQVRGIIEKDPFVSIDVDGVGELVRIASRAGREARPGIKLGICGEHGGDPASISFFETVGLNYVSCSPFRVPIARLAAAQASIRHSNVS